MLCCFFAWIVSCCKMKECKFFFLFSHQCEKNCILFRICLHEREKPAHPKCLPAATVQYIDSHLESTLQQMSSRSVWLTGMAVRFSTGLRFKGCGVALLLWHSSTLLWHSSIFLWHRPHSSVLLWHSSILLWHRPHSSIHWCGVALQAGCMQLCWCGVYSSLGKMWLCGCMQFVRCVELFVAATCYMQLKMWQHCKKWVTIGESGSAQCLVCVHCTQTSVPMYTNYCTYVHKLVYLCTQTSVPMYMVHW